MKGFIKFLVGVYIIVLGVTCISNKTVEVDMRQEWLLQGGELCLKSENGKIYKEASSQSEEIVLNVGDIVTVNEPLEEQKGNDYIKLTTKDGEEGYLHINRLFEEFENSSDSKTLKLYRNTTNLVDKILVWGMSKVSSPITILITLIIVTAALIFLESYIDELLCNVFPSSYKSEEMDFDFMGYKLMPSIILVITGMIIGFIDDKALNNFIVKGLDINIIKGGYTLENMMNIGIIISIICTIALVVDIFINYSVGAGIIKAIYLIILNAVSLIGIILIAVIVATIFIVRLVAPVLSASISTGRRY